MADFSADPLLRLLPSDPPASFLAMSPADQARRGRVMLGLFGMGKPIAFCWAMALQTINPQEAELLADEMAKVDDDAIRSEVLARIDAENLAAKTPRLVVR